jgi:hypothetical protein
VLAYLFAVGAANPGLTGHLILEVLRGHERVEKLGTMIYLGVDLATSTAEVTMVVKGFPEIIDRCQRCSEHFLEQTSGVHAYSVCQASYPRRSRDKPQG